MQSQFTALDIGHVVLDTSALYHDFDLSNRETTQLLQEASRGVYRVFVPEVVIHEMTSHCREQLAKTRRDLDAAKRFLSRVLAHEVGDFYERDALEAVARRYESVLRRRLREHGVQILRLPRGVAAVRDLLWRERLKRKPFKQDGQGVPDVLLWESVLELCRREPRPVVLITRNWKDFGLNGQSESLHPDLLEDLQSVGVTEARLHGSIAAFNNEYARSFRAEPSIATAQGWDQEQSTGDP